MAITSIGSGADGLGAAELIRSLTNELAKELGASLLTSATPGEVNGVQRLGPESTAVSPAASVQPVTDIGAVLMSEVATSDLAKLGRILEPASNPDEIALLETLLRTAIQEVANGNAERAVGYLADYATRAPRQGEALPFVPALEPVRDKLESMVGRMTIVAKMSAEDGLSRAEQDATKVEGKISNWETHADVLLRLAHRFFDSGGYANYSRTAELARLVSDAAETKIFTQALAASASASSAPLNPLADQLVPGVNVPYWVPPDMSVLRSSGRQPRISRRSSSSAMDDFRENWKDLKEISSTAARQLWRRAPLLVMLLTWLIIGLTGGMIFVVVSHLWPQSLIVAMGNFVFGLWGLGFLAIVGFGFYVRVRFRSFDR